MKIFFLNILFLFATINALSQKKEINGIVYSRFTNKGDSIVGDSVVVGIKMIHKKYSKTPDATTNNDGCFQLKIDAATKSPTQITIDNTGKFKNYKIVNESVTNNISTTSKDSVKVFVGDRKSIDQQRMRFYNVNRNKIIEDFVEKISQLETSNENYESEVKKIEKERDAAIDLINKMSEQIKELNLEIDLLKNNPNVLYDNLMKIFAKRYEEATIYFMKGENKKALSKKRSKEEKSYQNISNEIFFNSDKLTALIYTAEGDYTEAINWYQDIIDSRYSPSEIDIFFIYLNKAELEQRLGKYSDAEKDINDALEKKVNDIYKIKAYNLLGNVLRDKGTTDYADNYEKAIKLYQEKKKETGNVVIPVAEKEAAISYASLAKHYQEKEKYLSAELAKHNYLKALDIYIELNKTGEIERYHQRLCLLKLAQLFQQERKDSLAQQCFRRADMLDTVKNNSVRSREEAQIYTEIAHLQLKRKDFKAAISKYNSTLAYYENQNDTLRMIKTYFNIGMAYYFSQEIKRNKFTQRLETVSIPDSAEINLQKGLKLLEQSKINRNNKECKKLEILFNATIGSVYEKKQVQDSAKAYWDKVENQLAGDAQLRKEAQLRKDIKYINKYGTGYDWGRIMVYTGVGLFFSAEIVYMSFFPIF